MTTRKGKSCGVGQLMVGLGLSAGAARGVIVHRPIPATLFLTQVTISTDVGTLTHTKSFKMTKEYIFQAVFLKRLI